MTDEQLAKTNGRGCSRRGFIAGAAVGAAGGGAIAWGVGNLLTREDRHQAAIAPPPHSGPLGLPGPFPGKVVEVHHPAAAKGGTYDETKKAFVPPVRNREAIKAMLDRGMRELVGSNDSVEAWRHFVTRGDRVGIKVVPVGMPYSISSPELVLEVIDALQKAGVRANDIMVFDRYEPEFRTCKYPDILPDGVHWECESVAYDDLQLNVDGQLAGQARSKKASGYDPDVYREMAFCHPGHDKADDRRFRSHLSMIISRKLDKFISLPVLKDHRSAGITGALKNLSHGSVNNVARSHSSMYDPKAQPYKPGLTLNQCGTFIPAIVSLPKIREKAVLQILDGLVATYEGGPGNWNPTFRTWNQNSLFFATDPVAMDHVAWQIINEKRHKEGWAPVEKMGLEGEHQKVMRNGIMVPSEQFHMRQPEHISLASTLGLGLFPMHLIRHKKFKVA